MKFSEYSVDDLAKELGYEKEDIDVDLTRQLQTYLNGAKAYIRVHSGKIDIELDEIGYSNILLGQIAVDFAINKSATKDNSTKKNPVHEMLMENLKKYYY